MVGLSLGVSSLCAFLRNSGSLYVKLVIYGWVSGLSSENLVLCHVVKIMIRNHVHCLDALLS